MIEKNVYLEKIQQIHAIMEKHGLSTVTADVESKLEAQIRDYAFRILLVGGFSAGKSAFLNTLLQRQDLLAERQGPETAIAAEMQYDTEEYVEAVAENGMRKRFPLTESSQFSPKDWRYLVYHLDNDYLRTHPDIILVDMPGIDSNREWHDRAITQYIERGSAFLLMVSCENGTLMESTADFLRESAKYPQGIYCFLTKTDLRTESEYKQTVETVASAIRSCYQADVPVTPVSVYDEDFTEKADAAISGFHPQELFEQKFRPEFTSLILLGRSALQTAEDAVTLDTSELDKKIRENAAEKECLLKEFERERAKLKRTYRLERIPQIRSQMESALQEQSERLVRAAATSPEAFNSLVNSILRPLLVQITQESVEGDLANFAGMVEDFGKDQSEDLLRVISEALEILGPYLQPRSDYPISPIEHDKPEKDSKGLTNAYTYVTGALAIATDVVNPVIELVIVALPHILSLLKQHAQEEKEQEMEQRMRDEIIPTLVDRLMPGVEEAVASACDAALQEMENKVREVLDANEQAMNQAMEEKKRRTLQTEKEKEAYAQDIRALEQML